MAPPDTVALMVGSCENDEEEGDDDDVGDVGLLPPHPAIADATAASDMAWQELTQNSRRVYLGSCMTPPDRNSRAAASRSTAEKAKERRGRLSLLSVRAA